MENVLRLSTSPHILPYIPALQEIVSPPQIERSDMDASMVSETHERTEEPTYSTPVRQPRPNLSKNDVAYDEASDAGQEADDQAVAETRQGVLPDEQRNGEGEDHVGELPPRSEKSSTKRNMARLESFEFDESYIDEDVDDYDDEGQQADLLMSETILNAPDMPAEPIGVTTQVDEDIRVSQTYPAQTAMVAAQRSVAEDIGNSIEIQQSTSGFDGLLMDDFFSEAPTDMVIPTPPPSVASTAFPPPPPPPPGSAPDLLNARIAMTNASEDWEPRNRLCFNDANSHTASYS